MTTLKEVISQVRQAESTNRENFVIEITRENCRNLNGILADVKKVYDNAHNPINSYNIYTIKSKGIVHLHFYRK
ncbi:MAG: hypothetical protein V1886_01170 [archaeon]